MAETFISIALFFGLVFIGMAILSIRDLRKRRQGQLLRELRPLAEQIAEIRDESIFMIQQLELAYNRKPSAKPEAISFLLTIIDYYRRLAELASNTSPSQSDILNLANESDQYIREHKAKGIYIPQQARKLADLLHRRDTENKKNQE